MRGRGRELQQQPAACQREARTQWRNGARRKHRVRGTIRKEWGQGESTGYGELHVAEWGQHRVRGTTRGGMGAAQGKGNNTWRNVAAEGTGNNMWRNGARREHRARGTTRGEMGAAQGKGNDTQGESAGYGEQHVAEWGKEKAQGTGNYTWRNGARRKHRVRGTTRKEWGKGESTGYGEQHTLSEMGMR